MSVEVGKYGRIVLPKEIRDKYNVNEGSRFIVREREGKIVLVPVRKFDKPTEALYGSMCLEKPIEEPKEVARKHVKNMLVDGFS